jgi:hypothetical protein
MRITLASTMTLLIAVAGLSASEPAAVAKRLDQAIDAKLKEATLTPAKLADDGEFMRRVYLDITGRVPTAKQAADFLASAAPDKRAKLIDELLASPQYGEQFGRVWRDWIAPAELPSEGNGGNQPIKATQDLGKWLAERFNKGDGWDTIVHRMLAVDGSLKQEPQAIFYSLVGDDQGRPQPAGAARAISSLFLGLQIQCAECHNDPFKEYKQADFWGMAAFFKNTSWTFNGRYFDAISEFDKMLDDGKNKRKLTIINDKAPNGKITIPKESFKGVGTVYGAKFIEGRAIEPSDKQPLRPILADWITARDNPTFAKAFVNRTWAYFFARGLVTPIDDLRPDNPASHPGVLDELAKEFTDSNFDVRHLVRCVVQTRAYQRSSKPSPQEPKELPAQFGRMPVRLMSADVLYDSLRLAMTDPNLDLRGYDSKDAQRFGESSPTGSAYDEFVKLFLTNEEDATEFTHGIPQFLALINHPKLRTGGKTVEDLIKAKTEPAPAIETLYLATLSRKPSAEEAKEAADFATRVNDPKKAYSGILWMLVNRSEFLLVR